jgi:hypothetical protein
VSTRRDQGVAVGCGPDAEQELLRAGVLQQESGGAGAQRVEDVFVDVEGGEHHHLGQAERDDPPGRLEAVHPGHPDVHEHDVRPRPGHLADRRDPVLGLADHFEVGLGLDEHADARPHQRLSSAIRTRIVTGAPAARRAPRTRRRAWDPPAGCRPAAGRARPGPANPALLPRPAAGNRRRRGRVVLHRQVQAVIAVADRHAGRRGPRVPQGVGQRLLDDPVGRQLHGRGQRARRPGDRQPDLHPGGPRAIDQVRQVVQSRLRPAVQLLMLVAPQRAHDPVQLDQALPRAE